LLSGHGSRPASVTEWGQIKVLSVALDVAPADKGREEADKDAGLGDSDPVRSAPEGTSFFLLLG